MLNDLSVHVPMLFPVHPRTRRRMDASGFRFAPRLRLCDPLSYLTFLGLMSRAKCVLTDSGGIQEETTALRVPCLTLRRNTERPVTVSQGTNRLVGSDTARIREGFEAILNGSQKTAERPPLWDGRAAQRIVDIIEKWPDRP